MSIIEYEKQFKHIPLQTRKAESARIRARYPGRCCVIVSQAAGDQTPAIDRHKFLVPGEVTMGQFTFVIRRRIKINPEKAIFTYVNGALPPTSSLMSQIYNERKDEDGFLYVTYAGENTFG